MLRGFQAVTFCAEAVWVGSMAWWMSATIRCHCPRHCVMYEPGLLNELMQPLTVTGEGSVLLLVAPVPQLLTEPQHLLGLMTASVKETREGSVLLLLASVPQLSLMQPLHLVGLLNDWVPGLLNDNVGLMQPVTLNGDFDWPPPVDLDQPLPWASNSVE